MTDDRYTLTLPSNERPNNLRVAFDGKLWRGLNDDGDTTGVYYLPTVDPDLLERAAAIIRQYRADHAPKPRVVRYEWPGGSVRYYTRHRSSGAVVSSDRDEVLILAAARELSDYPDTLLDALNDLRARPTEDGR
jgi:hypothetical protein